MKGPGEEVVETNIKETPGLAEMIDEKQQAPESVPSDKKDDNVSEAGTKKRRASNRHYDSTDRGRSRYYRQPRQGKDFDTIVDEFLNAKKPRNVAEGSASRGRSVSPGSRRSPRRQSPGGKRYRGRRERRRRSEERRNVRKRQRCRDYDGRFLFMFSDNGLFICSTSRYLQLPLQFILSGTNLRKSSITCYLFVYWKDDSLWFVENF